MNTGDQTNGIIATTINSIIQLFNAGSSNTGSTNGGGVVG